MGWVNPSTIATATLVTAARWNQDVVSNTEFLARPPSVRVQKSTDQSITNNTHTMVSWNAESWDTDTMWSSTAPTRIDINTSGKYLVTAFVCWGTSTSSTGGNVRQAGVLVDGTTSANSNRATSVAGAPKSTSIPIAQTVSDVLSLTSTQFLRLNVYQDSGAALSVQHTTGTGARIASMTVTWISS